MSGLTIKDLTKKYHSGVVAVDHFDLEIKEGECVVVYGLDRSGKSTLLRMIAGLEEVSEGTLLLGKRDITNQPTKNRNLSYAFRDTALDNKETVFDNLAYGLRARKMPEPVVEIKVKAVAEILGLSDCLQRKPKTLSSLERRRIILGRTIVRDPEVYLFDEPLAGMDGELCKAVLQDLIKAHARLGATFLYATDNLQQAVSLADRMVVLSEGKIVQIDTPENLYKNPVNEFVAELMDCAK